MEGEKQRGRGSPREHRGERRKVREAGDVQPVAKKTDSAAAASGKTAPVAATSLTPGVTSQIS